jgi:hypothetical protein
MCPPPASVKVEAPTRSSKEHCDENASIPHRARESAVPSRLEDLRMPVQAKLAAAWTSFMFLYIYVDYLALYKPGVIDDIRGGVIFEFDISPTLLTILLAS